MKKHVVKQNEDLINIALNYNISDWQEIYNHQVNQRLKQFRPDPMALMPGDIVYIPDTEPLIYKLATNQSHVIKVHVPKADLVLVLEQGPGQPLKNAEYELQIGANKISGKTDAAGRLEQKQIDIRLKTARLRVWPEPKQQENYKEYTINLGALDPSDEVSGLQAHLENLGYACGGVDNDFGPVTYSAIRAFQADHGLEVTGNPDHATLAKIDSLCK